MKKLVIQMGLCLFLASCGETADVQQPELPAGTPVDVIAELSVSVSSMTALCTSTTRSQGGDSHSKALQVDYLSGSATRAEVAMSSGEKEIKSAYVVQFNGTSAGSTAVWVSADVSALVKSGSPVNCSFTLTSGVKSRVYVIANPTKVPTVNMTLQSFETVSYTVSTLPNSGLPMVASQDVALGETFSFFQLKSPLARLTFTTNTGSLSLRGIPSAYSLVPATAGNGPVRPSGITYTTTAALTSGTTYYIPANLSGRVDLSSPVLRCSAFAPANSMYVVISANSTTYNVYLGDGSAGDFNVVGNYAYAISASVNGTDAGDMRVGNVSSITALDGSGTANCYIATGTNTWYSFNGTVMGNGKSTPVPADLNSNSVASAITPSALSPASAGVLWETLNTTSTPAVGSIVNRMIYIVKGRILFRTGSSQGNAVIAARDASNNIIWSWHIWRTNTTPATQPLDAISGFATAGELQIMDRNLGALSAAAQNDLSTGLIYQWGRKDPFPGGADLASKTTAMATQPAGIPSMVAGDNSKTPADAVKYPTSFYTSSSGNYDWTSRNDNFWGTPLTVISGVYTTNKGSKTIYDPCPPGWRIPPGYTFKNASTSNGGTFNKGYSFSILTSGSSWFPASGFRGSSSGPLNYIGSYGYFWVATPYVNRPTDGSRLSFYSTSVSPSSNGSRALGSGCRCAKE